MKIVSFEVAKALKEAEYPQATEYWYSKDGELCYSLSDLDEIGYISCPTYLSAWLWLWREKKEYLPILPCCETQAFVINHEHLFQGLDPEEAIAKAIDYLVENNLIK